MSFFQNSLAAGAVAQESLQSEELPTPTPTRRTRFHGKAYTALQQVDVTHRHTKSVQQLKESLQKLELVTGFAAIAKQHNLSAPLVAAFRSTPGFEKAVKGFPATQLFNVVPEHVSTANNKAGLESFEVSQNDITEDVKAQANAVSSSFDDVLSGLATTADNLSAEVADSIQDLEASDITDEVMDSLPVQALSSDAFTEAFTKLTDYLSQVEAFDVDHLRADPEKIKAEIDALTQYVDELGSVIGVTVNEEGLTDADKAEDYVPTPATFGEKGITKAGLIFHLGQASQLLDALKRVGDVRETLVASTQEAATDMPVAIASDDVTYGAFDHVTLLTSYTTLVSKLVRESILLVSTLLSTADAALHIDDGMEGEAIVCDTCGQPL